MTSANTIVYIIRDSNGNQVGEHSWNIYCKARWEELKKFSPPENYTIQPTGYDEDDEYWEDSEIKLDWFLKERML
jgi:hypothetical protein